MVSLCDGYVLPQLRAQEKACPSSATTKAAAATTNTACSAPLTFTLPDPRTVLLLRLSASCRVSAPLEGRLR